LHGAGTTSANFLKISIGARQIGMGESFAGLSDDVNSINYNIAGLSQLGTREFSAMHLEYLQGIKYETLSYSHPFKWGAVGLSLGYLYVNDIPKTIIDPNAYTEGWQYRETGSFGADDKTLLLGFSREIEKNIFGGLGVRYLSETLDDVNSWAVSFDVGCLYRYNKKFSFGASIQNVGTELKFIEKRERIPIIFRAGIGYRNLNGSFKTCLDFVQAIDNDLEIRTGFEYAIVRVLFLRIGYRMRGFDENYKLGYLSGLTAGVGFSLFNYNLDYGFVPYGDLGYTHRISLSGRF